MAEDLNGFFSSVFTREDINSLPVPDTNFRRVNQTRAVYWNSGKGS